MAASASSPADVLNLALARMGYKRRVGSLLDGSEAASRALDIYGQTRDALIRMGNWDFARFTTVGNLLKEAPLNYIDAPWNPALNPPPPWQYEYAYPADCLEVRQLQMPPGFLVDVEPRAVLWSVLNDNAAAPKVRSIVTNVQNALIVYAGRVTNPSNWPPDFTEALAAELAIRLKPVLVSAVTNADIADATASVAVARTEQG